MGEDSGGDVKEGLAMAKLYPRHNLTKFNTETKRDEIVCAEPMMLPEQVGPRSVTGSLYCLGCKGMVETTPSNIGQAEEAARDEGWAGPSMTGAVTVGTLPDDVRSSLLWALRVREWTDASGNADAKSAATSKAEKASLMCAHLGLMVAPWIKLTLAGLDMARQIASPPAPVDRLRFDPAHAPKPAKVKPEPKRRPVAPSAPLVCKCGHGVLSHLDRDRDVSCKGEGCKCKCYVQAKPEAAQAETTEPKKKKRERKAKVPA